MEFNDWIDFWIWFELGLITEFLLNFFSYFNKALSPFFLTSLTIFVTEIELALSAETIEAILEDQSEIN